MLSPTNSTLYQLCLSFSGKALKRARKEAKLIKKLEKEKSNQNAQEQKRRKIEVEEEYRKENGKSIRFQLIVVSVMPYRMKIKYCSTNTCATCRSYVSQFVMRQKKHNVLMLLFFAIV